MELYTVYFFSRKTSTSKNERSAYHGSDYSLAVVFPSSTWICSYMVSVSNSICYADDELTVAICHITTWFAKDFLDWNWITIGREIPAINWYWFEN